MENETKKTGSASGTFIGLFSIGALIYSLYVLITL